MTRAGSAQRIDLPGTPGGSMLLEGHLDTMAVPGGIRPLRLPLRHWSHFPAAGEILRTAVSSASGVRLRTQTSATRLALRVRCTGISFEGSPVPQGGFAATVGGETVATAIAPLDRIEALPLAGDSVAVTSIRDESVVTFAPLPPGEKTVTILLPPGMMVDLLGLDADAPCTVPPADGAPVWVHYGSSISHCADPTPPTSVWPTVAAHLAGLDVVNLGFGGQCMLDPFVADAIAEAPADVISIKVGVNIVGARAMDQRTFGPALHGFLDRVRRGHPDVPIILASSILWPGSEDTPGPSGVEFLSEGGIRCFTAGDPDDIARGALTMTTSRRIAEQVVQVRAAAGEPIHYLDGFALYGPDDADRWQLPDSLHPDAALYEEIGRRFAERVFAAHGLVPRAGMG